MRENWEIRWKDYYKLLQVRPSAKQEAIKAAHHRLAKKFHPDINRDPSANQRMKDINESYYILGDIEKRRRYDEAWLQNKQAIAAKAEPRTPPKPETPKYYSPVRDSSKRQKAAPAARRGPSSFPSWGKWIIGLGVLGVLIIIIGSDLENIIVLGILVLVIVVPFIIVKILGG